MNRREIIPPKSILEAICKPNNAAPLRIPPALQWGIENEKVALMQYQDRHGENIIVVDYGLFINPNCPCWVVVLMELYMTEKIILLDVLKSNVLTQKGNPPLKSVVRTKISL